MRRGLILLGSALALTFTLIACAESSSNSDSAKLDQKAKQAENNVDKVNGQALEDSFKLSSDTLKNKFKVTVYPQSGKTEIGGYHNWIIQVQDPQGKAVEGARMSVGGGMEAHGHGLPSKPQVTEYLGEGKYLIEGMQFNMSGRWTLLFVVQTASEMDRVRFDFDLAF